MPCLNVSTNVNLDGVDTSAVLADASKTVATIIGKPEAYVMVVLKGSVPMAFGGTQEPAAYGELVSIGGLNPDVNKKLSAGIASILESKLSIPKGRFYLKFYDSKGAADLLSSVSRASRRSSTMAAVSPPLLPTTVLPADTTVSPADANPAATRAFLARLLDSVKRALSGARPWPELIDRTALSRPDSLSDATARLRKNLAYFRVNYAAIVALSLAASLLAHPFSLAALLALLAAWCFLYLLRPSDAPPLAAFGRTFSDRETLGGLIVASAFVVFLTSVGSLIFSALALGAAIVCAHGAFRIPEDLFLDEPDQANAAASVNLLSFITSATGARV
uniref:PRA1 family protein n=2 Tax=Oryza punctata TaxID=4537 RepID=A0A0E0MIQ7_ORYPU